MRKIKIVNLHYDQCHIRIDRSSPFGNKFKIGRDGNRNEVCDKHAKYVDNHLELVFDLDAVISKLPRYLEVVKLGCWCKPKRCHGDTYKKLLEQD